MRRVDPGINWIWYMTDTREEAIKWYKELTGVEPEFDSLISEIRGEYGFRLRK